MTPEYIEHLAALADPAELWRENRFADLTIEQSQQRDAGIALRRHASHVRRLHALVGTGRSLLITPMSPNGARIETVPDPRAEPDHIEVAP